MSQTTDNRLNIELGPLRESVNRQLDHYSRFTQDSDWGRCPARLRDAIRHSLLAPAKRLRPLLALCAAETCGGDPLVAMPAACAVEMVHTYSLIHDDLPCMDDDDLRRGIPTCHRAFDEATAVLAGDALLALAFEILAVDVQPPELASQCCAQLATAAGAGWLVGGQIDDLAAEGQVDGTLADLEAIHRRKTGAMLRVALRLGGMLANANNEQIRALDSYGTKLGLAFQIVDDLLDHAGSQQAMGKRTQKDRERGKLTYPALLGVQESRARAERLVTESIEALSIFDRAANLADIARYVVERNN